MKHARVPQGPSFGIKLAVFIGLSLLWLLLDRATKIWADSVNVGEVLASNIAGLFEFRLVHNTGAAWGIFSDSTLVLGLFSIVVCILLLVLLCTYLRKTGSMWQFIFLAFVFAGGLGNAIDRLSLGYVVDFIHTTFIEFPVFNVADIGVTCGIILFLLATMLGDAKRARMKD